MGWWKVEGTGDVVGDVALDALAGAVSAVVAAYQHEFTRRPTPREWEALLFASLAPECEVLDGGSVTGVHLDVLP